MSSICLDKEAKLPVKRDARGALWVLLLAPFLLSSCAETEFVAHAAKQMQSEPSSATARGEYKVGNPYQIRGVWYYPKVDYDYRETGIASWYGPNFHGRPTANGERFDMNALSAAHRTLPLPSFVQVTNLENGRRLVLRVNDRGPFAHGRIIDVSRRAAEMLGFKIQGTARVRVSILAAESRAVAARMQGESQVVMADAPIAVDGMPKDSVSSESLPLPPGGIAAPSATPNRSVLPQPAPARSRAEPTVTVSGGPVEGPPVGLVSTVPVQPTQMFVQAGAYGLFENANRVRMRLSRLGSAFISHVLVKDRDMYRVRLGPVTEVARADAMLERVIQAGFNDARILVE